MKKLFICFLLLSVSMCSFSQTVIKNRIDCKRIHATKRLTWYTDSISHVNDSVYFTKEYDNITSVNGPFYIENIYHYDGKTIFYHSLTMNLQFINIKNKELKNELSLYQLPKLSKEELKQQIQIYDNEVKAYAMLRNMQCIKSIKYEIYKKSDRYRDSVKYVQDSIKQYFLSKKRELYIASHKPRVFTAQEYLSLYKDCFYSTTDYISKDETIYILGYENDTLQYTKANKFREFAGKKFYNVYTTILKPNDAETNELSIHLNYFNDSLSLIRSDIIHSFFDSWYYLDQYYDIYTESVTKQGYFENIGFNQNSVGGINPYFTFTNTNDKTVKYVEINFNVYNAVDDRCKDKYSNTYSFTLKGVGPIEKFSKAVFDWTDNPATHYTSYDASYMKINKVKITYMDNSTVTLTGKNIIVN